MRHRAAVCSLTIDEVQNHLPELGKPLNQMKLDRLDELLSSFSAVDQASSSCSSIADNSVPLLSNYNHSINKRTDEVWHGIVPGNAEKCVGETTLEEFLFRTGAIHLGSQDHCVMQQQQQQQHQQQHSDWWNYQEEQKQQISMLNSNVSVFVNKMIGDGCGVSDNHQMGMQGMVALPRLKHTMSDPQFPEAMKQCDESFDKSFQRKQKRMIKNRESAARSRARKQVSFCLKLSKIIDYIHIYI